jgi:hypothetical protein
VFWAHWIVTVSLETTRLVKTLIQLRFFTSCQWHHCNCAMSNGMMQIILCPDLYTTLNHPQFWVFRGWTESSERKPSYSMKWRPVKSVGS